MRTEIIIAVVSAIFASSGLWSFILTIYNTRQKKKETNTLEKQALLGLLHETLLDKCKYYVDKGEISEQELRDLDQYLYKPYLALGGDGLVETLHASLIEIIKL